MKKKDFEFCLFCVDPIIVKAACLAGVDTFIVDWENKKKQQRQEGFDTQINHHTISDLKIVRKTTKKNVICRINSIGDYSEEEIKNAIDIGANEILIPMVRSVEEVTWVLNYVSGKCKVGILIETNKAIACAVALSQLPLRRIYVGLNDLAIENNNKNIFIPLVDKTVEQLRNKISLPFGFGGVTLPNKGYPISARLLIAELVRLQCDFSFLRRSFLEDTKSKDIFFEMEKIKKSFLYAQERSPLETYLDHKNLVTKILSIQTHHEKISEQHIRN